MKWIPLKERLVNEKTIDRYADKTAVACMARSVRSSTEKR